MAGLSLLHKKKMYRYCLFFFYLQLSFTSLSGQCPDRDFLWHRIIYLRDSTSTPAKTQLLELSGYLAKFSACKDPIDSTYALLLRRIGWLYGIGHDYQKAIDYTLKSIDIVHKNFQNPKITEGFLIESYNNLWMLYDSVGQANLKYKAIDSCISISIKLRKDYNYILGLLAVAINYQYGKGDYYRAITYSSIGEDICRIDTVLSRYIDFFSLKKINSLIYIKEYSKADSLTKTTMDECLRKNNMAYYGSYLFLSALIAEMKKDSASAVYYSKKSIEYNLKYKNYPNICATWNNLGQYLYFQQLHDNKRALYNYQKALPYAKGDFIIEILNNIANVFRNQKDFKTASYYFKSAFNQIFPGLTEQNILSKPVDEILQKTGGEYIIKLTLDQAEAEIENYKYSQNHLCLDTALALYTSADKLMDKIKHTQSELLSKLFWSTETRRLYEHAIECCYLLGLKDQAFRFFERSRAIILNDQLMEQQTGEGNLMALFLLKKKISILEKETGQLDPGSKLYSTNQRDLFITKENLKRLDLLINEKNPWIHQSLLDTNFISLKEVQNVLLRKWSAKTILELFNGDSALYTLTIGPKTTHISKIDKKQFILLEDDFIRYISNPSAANRDFSGFSNIANKLFGLLFDSTLSTGRIIVSPDGQYFPFEALVVSPQKTNPEYLLNNHIVSYTYSVRFLMNDFKKPTLSSFGNFYGLAPVDFPHLLELSSLGNSAESIENICRLFPGSQKQTGIEASRGNFLRLFPNYKIIQLYTHASDTSNSGEPVIYFRDSALYLSELFPETRNTAQLIVLSACETGKGKDYKGEGVFSFNRGFAAMGIPSSVINLWSVDNESTYAITELFYKYVARHYPLDVALQKAKLEFISHATREKKLPYYWAATVLVGKTDPVILTGRPIWKDLLFSLLLIGGVWIGWKKFPRRRLKKNSQPMLRPAELV